MRAQTALIIACSLVLSSLSNLAAAQPTPIREVQPRVDRYGDPLPAHALIRIGTTRLRPNVDNGGRIQAMAFTKDGKRLVTISDWTAGKVWDAVTGKRLLGFGVKPAVLGGIVYSLSADGSRAAIIESEKVCRFYDTANGKEIGSVIGDWRSLEDLRFSPDSKLLGVLHYAEPGAVAVWDVTGRSQLWQIPVPLGICSGAFAFTPDGKIVVCAPRPGSKPTADSKKGRAVPLLFYDATQGPKAEHVSPMTIIFPPGPLAAPDGKEFTFSPDGKLLADREYSRQFMLWDFTTGKLLHEPKIDDDDQMGVFCLCFSPDGKGIFTGSHKVRLWDVVTGKMKREFSGYDETILALAVSPDGKRVAASGVDDTMRVWDVDSGKELFSFEGHRMRNVRARFASNGETIISIGGPNPSSNADERTYRIWDGTTGKLLKRVELPRDDSFFFCLSRDANILFTINAGNITKRHLVSGKIEAVRGLPANYARYECSSDGTYLAGQTEEFSDPKNDELMAKNTVGVVNTTTGKIAMAFEGGRGEMFHCRFTHDGHYLAVHSFCYGTDGRRDTDSATLKLSFLRIWDMQTGRKTSESTLLTEKWNDFRWPGGDSLSPDRTLALTPSKDSVELRDVTTNAKIARFPSDDSECESWAFSQDGKFIAVGDNKGQILLWSVSARKRLGTLDGHIAAVTSVDFSPDGKKLVSGSDDTTIVVWNIAQWTAPTTPKYVK